MLLPVFAEISGKTPIYENTKNLFWNLCKTLNEDTHANIFPGVQRLGSMTPFFAGLFWRRFKKNQQTSKNKNLLVNIFEVYYFPKKYRSASYVG